VLRDFYLLSGLLLVMSGMVMAHYLLSDTHETTEQLKTVAGLSRISSLSLSVAYYEPRIRRIEKAANPAYPEMLPLDRMDFVYAE